MTKPKALQPFVVPTVEKRKKAWPKYLRAAQRSGVADLIRSKTIPSESGCWEWAGPRNERGYGIISTEKTTLFAHRLSLLAHGVKFSYEDDVDHLCRNRCCVNPDHLEPVTHLENVRRGDSTLKDGRCRKGHDNWKHYPTGRQCDSCNRIRKGRSVPENA